MINWLYKYKYTRRGIEHLMKYIVIISAVVFVLQFVGINLYSLLMFDAGLILKGQIWRVFTFVFLTPSSNILFAVFAFYMYYLIGETLEQQWGSFAFTVYYLLNVVVCALIGLLTGGQIINSYYINLAMFLAYGFSYPDNSVLLFMFIPIKMKYLAWIYAGMEILWFITGPTWPLRLIPLSGLLSFVIFFWPDIMKHLSGFYGTRKKTVTRQKNTRNIRAIHKCEVCGRTEFDDPDLQFRFCSGCRGYHEYCLEHLYMHEHKTE